MAPGEGEAVVRKFIVCGLGRSMVDAVPCLAETTATTIGVNDIYGCLDPDYVLILDRPERFLPCRRDTITQGLRRHRSPTGCLFTPYVKQWSTTTGEKGRLRRIKTKKYNLHNPWPWDEMRERQVIPHFVTSPFAGIGLAEALGAEKIGLIGVDLLGDHHMSKNAGRIDAEMARLQKELAGRGVELVNLSKISRLKALPFSDLRSF